MEPEIQQKLERELQDHRHEGNISQRISAYDLDDVVNISLNVISQTVGTAAGNYDAYFMVPQVSPTATIERIDFSGTDALATSDTNYITWTITNLGQDGAGTNVILGTENTKVTGGSAIAANTKRTFTLTTEPKDLNVVIGDRIRIRAAVTGTLANTVTFPVYLIQLTQ